MIYKRKFRSPQLDFDPADAAYLYGHTDLKKNDGTKVAKSLFNLLKTIFLPAKYLQPHATRLPNDSVIFFATSKNQAAAIEPILRKIPDVGILLSERMGTPYRVGVTPLQLIRFYIYFLTALFHSRAHARVWLSRLNPGTFVKSYFAYFISYEIFRDFSGIVVVSNDHSPFPRAMTRAAKEIGIHTSYVQHAAVSSRFPPLAFHSAFLDGQAAFDTYRHIAAARGLTDQTNVYILGCAKADHLFELSKTRSMPEIIRIGLAINTLDDSAIIIRTINQLTEISNLPLRIRLHPRMIEQDHLASYISTNSNVIHVHGESLEDFLSNIDLLISGQSSIHLEAVASGVVSCTFNLGARHGDYYSFLRRGVSLPLSSITELASLNATHLKSIQSSQRQNLRYFYANDVSPEGAAGAIGRQLRHLLNSKPQ